MLFFYAGNYEIYPSVQIIPKFQALLPCNNSFVKSFQKYFTTTNYFKIKSGIRHTANEREVTTESYTNFLCFIQNANEALDGD